MPVPALEWREAARADLLAIIDRIFDDNPDAVQRLKDDIKVKASKLPQHPKLYRAGRVAGTRKMVVRPSHVAIYAKYTRTVSILPVLHAAQQRPLG